MQEGKILSKYLDKIGIDSENDLAVLSFLQHYGCPTPLLDWTYSFPNALFFALQNLKKPEGTWEIEKYFCVYYLEEEFFEKASLQKIFDIGLKKQKETKETDVPEWHKDVVRKRLAHAKAHPETLLSWDDVMQELDN